MDEPAIEGYAESADVLFEDGDLTGVSLFPLWKNLPKRSAGEEEGEQYWEQRSAGKGTQTSIGRAI